MKGDTSQSKRLRKIKNLYASYINVKEIIRHREELLNKYKYRLKKNLK